MTELDLINARISQAKSEDSIEVSVLSTDGSLSVQALRLAHDGDRFYVAKVKNIEGDAAGVLLAIDVVCDEINAERLSWEQGRPVNNPKK